MTLQTSINAKQIMFYSSTDFCVNLFIPSEKAVHATLTALFDVRDRHQHEAGKSAIGLNVARFLKTDSQS